MMAVPISVAFACALGAWLAWAWRDVALRRLEADHARRSDESTQLLDARMAEHDARAARLEESVRRLELALAQRGAVRR